MKVHIFRNSGAAYDASMTTVPTGEILVVPREQVVGVSAAWPIAVTVAHGELHKSKVPAAELKPMGTLTLAHLQAAAEAARLFRWPLDPILEL